MYTVMDDIISFFSDLSVVILRLETEAVLQIKYFYRTRLVL